MYSKHREHTQELKTSSLERVPDYRGFGLERFHCTYMCICIHSIH